MRQEKLLNETDWDLLIILDACRYDYFKEIYPEYLEGDLKKAISPASNTGEWCEKVLGEKMREDVTLFSTNPHLNSKTPIETANYTYDPRGKFREIVDLWLSEWDEERGVVLPSNVTRSVLNYEWERAVVWYIQPHAPYLKKDLRRNPSRSKEDRAEQPSNIGGGDEPFFSKLVRSGVVRLEELTPRITSVLYRIFKVAPIELRSKIVGAQLRPLRKTLYQLGQDELKKLYSENLEIVLESVSRLVGEVKGKAIITSDHGEGLGDEMVSHPPHSDAKVLREVPWLEVEDVAR